MDVAEVSRQHVPTRPDTDSYTAIARLSHARHDDPMEMTVEDRVRALEDVVMALSNIVEARVGNFNQPNIDQRVALWGSLVHKWAGELAARRSEP